LPGRSNGSDLDGERKNDMRSGLVAAIVLLLAADSSLALINPKFTPVNLVEQADLIAVVKVMAPDDKGVCPVEIKRVLKGRDKGKLAIDLRTYPQEEQVKAIKQALAKLGDEPVLLFDGKDEKGGAVGFLHMHGAWLRLQKGEA
jgi:hypothetical protein